MIKTVPGDITTLAVDAIVNAANEFMPGKKYKMCCGRKPEEGK